MQKLSKLAVYAVIRGQLGDAKRKLHDAAIIANKILTTVSTVIVYFNHSETVCLIVNPIMILFLILLFDVVS